MKLLFSLLEIVRAIFNFFLAFDIFKNDHVELDLWSKKMTCPLFPAIWNLSVLKLKSGHMKLILASEVARTCIWAAGNSKFSHNAMHCIVQIPIPCLARVCYSCIFCF